MRRVANECLGEIVGSSGQAQSAAVRSSERFESRNEKAQDEGRVSCVRRRVRRRATGAAEQNHVATDNVRTRPAVLQSAVLAALRFHSSFKLHVTRRSRRRRKVPAAREIVSLGIDSILLFGSFVVVKSISLCFFAAASFGNSFLMSMKNLRCSSCGFASRSFC